MVRRFLLSHYADSLIDHPLRTASGKRDQLIKLYEWNIHVVKTDIIRITDNKKQGESDRVVGEPCKSPSPINKGAKKTMREQIEMVPRFGIAEGESPATLKVIGVGGAGQNAVDNMIRESLQGLEFSAANTDLQVLGNTLVPNENRIQLGVELTGGRGAGGNPEIGIESAKENLKEIEKFLTNAQMLFIAAGMGGGTGTGAAPVIAELAKSKGILTVGVVTEPFMEEGNRRMEKARKGIEEMRKHVDTLIVIPNDRIFNLIEDDDLPFEAAFRKADDILYQATKGLSDIINNRGYINLDFEDAKAVITDSGQAVIGIGVQEGEDRAKKAAEEAINSPLLGDLTIKGAKDVLVNITGNEKMGMKEIRSALRYIKEEAGDQVDVYFGVVKNNEMGEAISITVIATGFDRRTEDDLENEEEEALDNLKRINIPKVTFGTKNDGGINGDQQKAGIDKGESPNKSRKFVPVDNSDPSFDYQPEGYDTVPPMQRETILPEFMQVNKNVFQKRKRNNY